MLQAHLIFVMTFALELANVDALAQSVPDLNDPRWGCYDPQPGHPKEQEKRQFIQAGVPIAQNLEQKSGPPAAGLLAIAALESGFGFTRTALFAHNFFGWKYTTPTDAVGRSAWTLACQPTSDPGNRYVVFTDQTDSFSFVGLKLERLPRYRPVTLRFHSDRAAGVQVEEAVQRWVRGIQTAGYNPNPSWADMVIAIANDFIQPNNSKPGENGLYKYSAAVANTPR